MKLKIEEKTTREVENFLKEYCYNSNYSNATIKNYSRALDQFFKFTGKDYWLIDKEDVELWILDLHNRGYKGSSIRTKGVAVKSFFQYLLGENLINKDPTLNIRLPRSRTKDTKRVTINEEERLRFFELASKDLKQYAIVQTLFSSGVRINELLNIRLDDIDMDLRKIMIENENRRMVLISKECKKVLEDYLASRGIESDYLFCNKEGNKISRSYVDGFFRKHSKELDIHVTPLSLRRAFATYLNSKGMPLITLALLLGQASINTILSYIQVNDRESKKEFDKHIA